VDILRAIKKIVKTAALTLGCFFAVIASGLLVTDFVISTSAYPKKKVAPDWSIAGHEQIVSIATSDPDGERRATPLWLVTVDNQPFIRTSNSKWLGNLKREPSLTLRSGGQAYDFIAEFVMDPALKQRVHRAFEAKYPLRTLMFEILGQNPIRLENVIRLVWAGAS
jgi:hypothetical protein